MATRGGSELRRERGKRKGEGESGWCWDGRSVELAERREERACERRDQDSNRESRECEKRVCASEELRVCVRAGVSGGSSRRIERNRETKKAPTDADCSFSFNL